MAELIVLNYTGDPPDNAAIKDYLALSSDADYTYVVTTGALERRRTPLAPGPQKDTHDVHLIFHKMLRHFLARRLLTRAEERVLVQRAAQKVASDAELARQLRHDVFAWRDALAALAQQGIDLSQGIPDELEERLVSPGVGHLLQVFQQEYRALQAMHNRQSFEDAAFDYLAQDYLPTPKVVMEGFTFLKPLQKHFVAACLKEGSSVYFLHPGRPEQVSGFAAVDRTVEEVLAAVPETVDCRVEHQTWVTGRRNRPGQLVAVQDGLFAKQAPPVPAADGSVIVTGYSHRHREIRACLETVKRLLDSEVDPRQIAIVMRRPYDFQALLEEEAAVLGINLGIGPSRRQLLLTPLGRFVLTLYQVWRDGALRINPDQFEAILASGWLGAGLQATAHEFVAVREQFFLACRARAEWEDCLAKLEAAQESAKGQPRLALWSVRGVNVGRWRAALDQVESLCHRLFEAGEHPIRGHVQRLLDVLSQLVPEDLRQTELEVIARIREALGQLAGAESLAMSPDEFGEVLNSLVQEQEEAERNEEDEPEQDGRVWVATPEAIDGYEKDTVFYLGVDDQRVPTRYVEVWPFYDVEVERHRDDERYLFLAVVRAAGSRLYLSYSNADQAGTYRPSPYLTEVGNLVGDSPASRCPSGEETPSPTAAPPVAVPSEPAHRGSYGLLELAHFRLCPFRYALERVDAGSGRFRTAFQVRLACEGAWLHEAFANLCRSGETVRGEARAKGMYHAALEEVRPSIATAFPALTAPDWAVVERWVKVTVDYMAKRDANYSVSVVPPRRCGFGLTLDGRTVQVDATPHFGLRVGKVEYPVLEDLIREEWLLPAKTQEEGPSSEPVGNLLLFVHQGYAESWFRSMVLAAYAFETAKAGLHLKPEEAKSGHRKAGLEISRWIGFVELGSFPRHPGRHCSCCPAKNGCLGLVEGVGQE